MMFDFTSIIMINTAVINQAALIQYESLFSCVFVSGPAMNCAVKYMKHVVYCTAGPQASVCWPLWVSLQWDCIWTRCKKHIFHFLFTEISIHPQCMWDCTGTYCSQEPEVDPKWRDDKIIFDLQVPCQPSSRSSCNLRVKSNTCYCCDLYNCGKWVATLSAWQASESVATCFAVLLWLFGIFDVYRCAIFVGDFFCTATALIVLEQECFFSFNLCFREHPLMGLQNKDVLKKFRKSSMIWK